MKYEKINIGYEINKIDIRKQKEKEIFNYKKTFLINRNYVFVNKNDSSISIIDKIISNKHVNDCYKLEKLFV